MIRSRHLILALGLLGGIASAKADAITTEVPGCPICTAWNAPQAPFKIYGNTYYVGVHGLSSLLIDTGQGLVLIDGDLPQSPPQIEANIKTLGFRLEDIKLILNSHPHFDHAGGINALQRLTGAPVYGSVWSAGVMRAGGVGRQDPQYGIPLNIDAIANVRSVADGETLRQGSVVFTAHYTPGHTPGGTSWTWTSCEKDRCLNMVYADSLNPASAPGFFYSHSETYPNALADFEKSFRLISALPCDILLTPHTDISGMLGKWQKRQAGATPDPFIDTNACRAFIDQSRQGLAERLEKEKSQLK